MTPTESNNPSCILLIVNSTGIPVFVKSYGDAVLPPMAVIGVVSAIFHAAQDNQLELQTLQTSSCEIVYKPMQDNLLLALLRNIVSDKSVDGVNRSSKNHVVNPNQAHQLLDYVEKAIQFFVDPDVIVSNNTTKMKHALAGLKDIFKVLFTKVDDDQIPFLFNSPLTIPMTRDMRLVLKENLQSLLRNTQRQAYLAAAFFQKQLCAFDVFDEDWSKSEYMFLYWVTVQSMNAREMDYLEIPVFLFSDEGCIRKQCHFTCSVVENYTQLSICSVTSSAIEKCDYKSLLKENIDINADMKTNFDSYDAYRIPRKLRESIAPEIISFIITRWRKSSSSAPVYGCADSSEQVSFKAESKGFHYPHAINHSLKCMKLLAKYAPSMLISTASSTQVTDTIFRFKDFCILKRIRCSLQYLVLFIGSLSHEKVIAMGDNLGHQIHKRQEFT